MPGVRLDGDWRRLIRTMESLELSDLELKAVNAKIGIILQQAAIERFEEEKTPEGRPWKPLAYATLVARARRRTRRKDGSSKMRTKKGKLTKRAQRIITSAAILKDTGRLMRSLAYRARPEGVAVGSNLVQAGIQQLGGKAGPGHKVEIPARPYLGVGPGESQDIQALLTEFVEERIR
ncbi:phage virion morphogenesis protein [Paradesulfitobacterium aromaticivorans]